MMQLIENKFANQYINNKRLHSLGEPFEIQGDIAIIRVYGALDDYVSFFNYNSYNSIFAFVDKIKADKSINNVAFIIDSPGGTVYKNSELYSAIAELPNTVAFVDNCCCSAAYWLASACNKIVATSELANFGSIGVLTSSYLDDNMVVITNTKSKSKYKDYKNKEDVKKVQESLDKIYSFFVKDITKKRIIDSRALYGDVFLTEEAYSLGLIDDISINCNIVDYFNNINNNKEEKSMDTKELIEAMQSSIQESIKASLTPITEELNSVKEQMKSMQDSSENLKKENTELKAKVEEQSKSLDEVEKAKAELEEKIKANSEEKAVEELAMRNTVAVQPNTDVEVNDTVVAQILKEGIEEGWLKKRA